MGRFKKVSEIINSMRVTILFITSILLTSCTEVADCPKYDFEETKVDTFAYFTQQIFVGMEDTLIYGYERFVYSNTKKINSIANSKKCKDGIFIIYRDTDTDENGFSVQISNDGIECIYQLTAQSESYEKSFQTIDDINTEFEIKENRLNSNIKKLKIVNGIVVTIMDTLNNEYYLVKFSLYPMSKN